MCQIDTSAKNIRRKGNNVDIKLICKNSGKPISTTNKYGMFCEDMCDLNDCKSAFKTLTKMLKSMSKE